MLYFEVMSYGTTIIGPSVVAELEEMVEFACVRDSVPQPTDEKIRTTGIWNSDSAWHIYPCFNTMTYPPTGLTTGR